MKKTLLLLFTLLIGVSGAWAQKNVIMGRRITAANQLVDGSWYLLQFNHGTGSGYAYPFIDDWGSYYEIPKGGNTPLESCVYKLIADGDNWKLQNKYNLKYWPVGAYHTQMAAAEAGSAGSWSLTFDSNGAAKPKSNDYGIDRNNPYLVSWETTSANTIRIYEVTLPAADETPVVISDYSGVESGNYAQPTPTETNYKYGNYSAANGANTFTTSANSGLAGVVISTSANILKPTYYSGANYYHCFAVKPGNQTKYTITVSAPTGYYISGYSLNTISTSNSNKFGLTIGEDEHEIGASPETYSGSNNSKSWSFDVQGKSNGGELCFPALTVVLKPLKYTVTYNVIDSEENILATDNVSIQEGNTVTVSDLPSSVKRAFCEYSFSDQTINDNTVINVSYTCTAPFDFSTNESPKYYFIHSREQQNQSTDDKYLNASGTTYQTTTVTDLTALYDNDAYKWAVIGNPYSFKIVNKQTSKPVAASANSGANGSDLAIGVRDDYSCQNFTLYGYGGVLGVSDGVTNPFTFILKDTKYAFLTWDGKLKYYSSGVSLNSSLGLTGWRTADLMAIDASKFDIALHSDNAGTQTYYATLYLPFDVTISNATAYTLAKSGSWLIPTAVTNNEVPAGTPVLLKGSNATATATINTGDAFNGGSSLACALTGTYTDLTATTSENYYLGKDNNGTVGFYRWAGTLGAYRAYLTDAAAAVKGFVINWGEETGITETTEKPEGSEAMFDLSGRRVSKAQKGLYIQNGKKLLVK